MPPFIGTNTPDLPFLSSAYIHYLNTVTLYSTCRIIVRVACLQYPSFKVDRVPAEALSGEFQTYFVAPLPPYFGTSCASMLDIYGTHSIMKQYILTLANNELLQMMMAGVFAYTAFTAVILATLQMPPEALLDSGLQEVLLVFED